MDDGRIATEEEDSLISRCRVRYESPTGDVYKGKLTLTEQRLTLDQEMASESPYKEELMQGVIDERRHLCISRAAIKSVDSKGGLRKKVTVRLNDGQEHIFFMGLFAELKIVDELYK